MFQLNKHNCVWSVCVIDEEISNMRRELDKYGIQMPAFSKIGGMLAHEVRQPLSLLMSSLVNSTVMFSSLFSLFHQPMMLPQDYAISLCL